MYVCQVTCTEINIYNKTEIEIYNKNTNQCVQKMKKNAVTGFGHFQVLLQMPYLIVNEPFHICGGQVHVFMWCQISPNVYQFVEKEVLNRNQKNTSHNNNTLGFARCILFRKPYLFVSDTADQSFQGCVYKYNVLLNTVRERYSWPQVMVQDDCTTKGKHKGMGYKLQWDKKDSNNIQVLCMDRKHTFNLFWISFSQVRNS